MAPRLPSPDVTCAAVQVASLPASQAWTPAEWEASRAPKAKASPAPGADAEAKHRSTTPDGAGPSSVRRISSKAADRAQDEAVHARKKAAEEGLANGVAANGEHKGNGVRRREGGLTLKERLQLCQQTEDDRITFGKVLTQWSCTEAQSMPQDNRCDGVTPNAKRQTAAFSGPAWPGCLALRHL